ncbi:hypothetical protein HYN59_13200 [Flavobacterium album]|uniref:Uncharacterized protein n=1 Tax=Flavobacterium album TaxID=2175091 RepID=A0A2S1R054_9FLAO|nr:hypothetical protein [Flavobacterium album]AWH86006.1 hypothetical protein HYN59_13200 [Flavobacterium album]
MDTQSLKEKIIRKIEETDDTELLWQIQDAISNYQSLVKEPATQYEVESDEDIVAYTIDGTALTRAEYIADIDSIINSNEKGIPHHEVKAQMDKWVQDRLNGIL